MSRIKKSRTAGNSQEGYTGKRKETSSQAQEAKERKRKGKLKGNKSGARNVHQSAKSAQQHAQNDLNHKRLGSKKAISLGQKEVINVSKDVKAKVKVEVKKSQPMPKVKLINETVENKLSPAKELELLENDPRLNDLLEQLDSEESIDDADQIWVEKQMARHQVLMTKLGWIDEDGEEDLIQQFEDASSALDEFK
ncbi:hypothetical protein PCNPT3_12450 [Psychromonas sp. CNPT3]|uniref:Der GTPase-activating protein YihI n=1 Tax=Psychromonas sp. CNPT3 TaxID=314282 RepID=UPI00006E8929|nr:Der GTPase-activating protein YihI [Psychromonas sp. CNPT3]AGH82426.1 hypothetical protein PCNPT3_12450 [Psychromonas sp. CNPT3]